MKSSDIAYILKNVATFGGVLAIDQLQWLRKGKCFVVNTMPSHHPGRHWIVIDWINSVPFLFDSFGKPPSYYGLPRHWSYSNTILQHPNSDTCGLYCIYYIVQRNKKITARQIVKPFGRNKKKNDAYVVKWIQNKI